MSRKVWILLAGVALVAVISFALFKKKQHSAVDYEVIKRGSIVESVYGIGTLTAQRSLSIKSGVTSTIRKLFAKEGEVVAKGARLVNLEGIGDFRAPFSGIVVSAPFKEGETVYAQTSVMTLVDPTDTYLLVSLEQQGALHLKPGLPVHISFDGLRDRVFKGRVESIYSNGGDFLAHISVQPLPKVILPGMTADVSIILQEKQDVLLVPIASLEDKNLVLSRNGKTRRVPVKLGLIDGTYAEIISGDVEAGDQAVLVKREIK
jgi:macrolide-specific efflux system membrane fusion protein